VRSKTLDSSACKSTMALDCRGPSICIDLVGCGPQGGFKSNFFTSELRSIAHSMSYETAVIILPFCRASA